MANEVLTPSIIAKEALMQLENNLVLGGLVHRGYEDEYGKESNGNKPGDTISIRRPVKYVIRSGAAVSLQDTQEGKTTIVVDQQKGVDISFQSSDMTLKIADFSKRYIKPAMITIANEIDMNLAALYKKVWNWVGTPGQIVNSFADFGLAPQRLTEMAVPNDGRVSVLSPADKWGMLGSFTGLFINDVAKTALQKAKLPMIGGVDVYETQNVATHTVGTKAGTPLIAGGAQNTTYTLSKDTNTQNLNTDGWTFSSAILKAGDVFTIANVFAVNPVNRATLPYLQQFVVQADISADGAGLATISIAPAIITSGPYQTVSAAPADNAAITVLGTASTGYAQNMVFHENAFALAMVPMELPEGAYKAHRETYKGLSIRVIPFYDGTNDISKWRFDVLYGTKAIYPDLATRLSGTA